MAEAADDLQTKFKELDKNHDGLLSGEEEITELSFWLCNQSGFTSEVQGTVL